MAEMDGLKKRVELIDLRLKSAHSAREQETAALMATWEQIRDRFQDQSAEIIKLRSQIADLEDSRDDLLNMVHSLLEAVEGGLDSMADETVPKIKSMAGQLLANNQDEIQSAGKSINSALPHFEPDLEPDLEPDEYSEDYDDAEETVASQSQGNRNFHDDLLTAIERTIDRVDDDDYMDEIPSPNGSDVVAEKDRSIPASPGIRNLVARIENAVGEEFFEPATTAGNGKIEEDDELSRDLQEIEALRQELHGLRHRISASAM